MTKYNMLVSVAMSVETDTQDIDQVPAHVLLRAMRRRLADLEEVYASGLGVLEAFEDLGDTYEMEEEL